ncbi:MAG TPA: endonuclease, partial [Bacteroidia bacterium]|nr:endonuclease [Bacteroidia bacterium]
MKKQNILWAVLICITNAVVAQSLSVQSAQINFGSVTELLPDSELVVLTNNNTYDVHVTGYHFYNTYGQPAFSTSAGNLTVPAGGNYSFWVKFSPRHNILHNSELVIECDGAKGFARVDLVGQGHYTNAYYNTSENLSEEALKTQLKTITGVGYRSLGYSPPPFGSQPCARDTMFMIIDNKKVNGQGATQNTIECVYTGREAVGYVDRTQCQDLTDPNMSFNTEHTWPQSLFSQLEPMRSDMFHLFPTDETANGKRSNYPFGVVTNPTWSNGGSKFDQNSGIFEPRDDHKGETARAMFYFVMRYQNYNNFLNTQESILRQWHYQFLPTAVEEKRCDDIQFYQKNRNPFIDYPQFVDRINSFSTTSVAPVVNTIDLPTDSIQYGLIDASLNNVYKFWIVNNGNAVVN